MVESSCRISRAKPFPRAAGEVAYQPAITCFEGSALPLGIGHIQSWHHAGFGHIRSWHHADMENTQGVVRTIATGLGRAIQKTWIFPSPKALTTKAKTALCWQTKKKLYCTTMPWLHSRRHQAEGDKKAVVLLAGNHGSSGMLLVDVQGAHVGTSYVEAVGCHSAKVP